MSVVSLPDGFALRGATDAEIPAVVRFVEKVMNSQREYFIVRYRHYPGTKAEHSRIVVHDGKIVAHQRLYRHEINFAGAVVQCWALGDVCTDPEYRRLGLGRALLEDCVSYIHSQGGPLCLIRAGAFYFYCSVGWESFPLPSFSVDLSKYVWYDEPGEYETRTFEEAHDLWQVAEVHRQYNQGRSLVRQRDGYFWANHRMWCLNEQGEHFVIAEHCGRIVAYGRIWHNTVTELCYLPGHEQGGQAVMQALLRVAYKRHGTGVYGALPKDHAAWPMLKNMPGFESKEDNYTLLRLTDLRLLFEQTLDTLSARLRQASVALSSPLAISCLGQSVTLVPNNGYLSLAESAAGERCVSLSQKQLLEFGAGFSSPSAVLAGQVDDATLRELDALFPLGNPIYWTSDTV